MGSHVIVRRVYSIAGAASAALICERRLVTEKSAVVMAPQALPAGPRSSLPRRRSPFEECSAGVDVTDSPLTVKEHSHRGPAVIVLVKPPSAQRSPLRIGGHRKLETQLVGLLRYVGSG
jgi:hypothetical protein